MKIRDELKVIQIMQMQRCWMSFIDPSQLILLLSCVSVCVYLWLCCRPQFRDSLSDSLFTVCLSCTEHLCYLRWFAMRLSTARTTNSLCLICKPARTRLSRESSSASVSHLSSCFCLFWSLNLSSPAFSLSLSFSSDVSVILKTGILFLFLSVKLTVCLSACLRSSWRGVGNSRERANQGICWPPGGASERLPACSRPVHPRHRGEHPGDSERSEGFGSLLFSGWRLPVQLADSSRDR